MVLVSPIVLAALLHAGVSTASRPAVVVSADRVRRRASGGGSPAHSTIDVLRGSLMMVNEILDAADAFVRRAEQQQGLPSGALLRSGATVLIFTGPVVCASVMDGNGRERHFASADELPVALVTAVARFINTGMAALQEEARFLIGQQLAAGRADVAVLIDVSRRHLAAKMFMRTLPPRQLEIFSQDVAVEEHVH